MYIYTGIKKIKKMYVEYLERHEIGPKIIFWLVRKLTNQLKTRRPITLADTAKIETGL